MGPKLSNSRIEAFVKVLKGAAVVGIRGPCLIGRLLDKQVILAEIRAPVLPIAQADFLRPGGGGVLFEDQVFAGEHPARIVQIGVRPERQRPHRRVETLVDDLAWRVGVVRVRRIGFLRKDGPSAGTHDGERPRRQLDVPQIEVRQPVDHLDVRAAGGQRQLDRLLDAVGCLDRLDQPQRAALLHPFDGLAVGEVGPGLGLGATQSRWPPNASHSLALVFPICRGSSKNSLSLAANP